MIRSIAAVIVGYLVMAILIVCGTLAHLHLLGVKMDRGMAHMDLPVSYAVTNLVYSSLFAAIGGWVCAAIAPRNRLKHGLILAALVFVLSLISVFIDRAKQPLWYQVGLVALGAPATALGAWVRARGDAVATAPLS